MTDITRISRRRMLTVAARVAGAATGAAIIATTTEAYAKVAQKTVKYQDTPKGNKSCESCALFEAPSSCKSVDGTISPQGWCMVYSKKPSQ